MDEVVGPGELSDEYQKENWAGISSFSIYPFHANKYLLSTCYVLGIIPGLYWKNEDISVYLQILNT